MHELLTLTFTHSLLITIWGILHSHMLFRNLSSFEPTQCLKLMQCLEPRAHKNGATRVRACSSNRSP